jgi:hypothetical protein
MEEYLDPNPFVEFLVLADRAEALNGKLYLMGGGWDRLMVADFGDPQSIWFAVGVVVPWSATNEEHRVTVILSNQDEIEVASAQFQFRAGASAIMERTESQKVLAGFQMQTKLGGPGMYTLKAMVNDDGSPEHSRKTFFYAKKKATNPA